MYGKTARVAKCGAGKRITVCLLEGPLRTQEESIVRTNVRLRDGAPAAGSQALASAADAAELAAQLYGSMRDIA